MNTENLRAFLQGDAVWVLGAIAVLLAVKAWRNSSWIQLFSVVCFFAFFRESLRPNWQGYFFILKCSLLVHSIILDFVGYF